MANTDFINIKINKKIIEMQTAKAVLISIPKTRYKFWLSDSCVHILPNSKTHVIIGIVRKKDYILKSDYKEDITLTGVELAKKLEMNI